jgi:hypothetical protein
LQLTKTVAKPRKTADGTAVSFECAYAFQTGVPTRGMQFVWVIAPKSGQAITRPVTLRQKGTLRTFNKESKPEDGPFECHIALKMPDGSLKPVSQKTPMK